MKECKECGDLIPEKRIKLMPNIEYCIRCQTSLEESGKAATVKMEISQEMGGGWFCESVKTKIVKIQAKE